LELLIAQIYFDLLYVNNFIKKLNLYKVLISIIFIKKTKISFFKLKL